MQRGRGSPGFGVSNRKELKKAGHIASPSLQKASQRSEPAVQSQVSDKIAPAIE